MVGDVNLFILSNDESMEYAELSRSSSTAPCAQANAGYVGSSDSTTTGEGETKDASPIRSSARAAELMVMIAEQSGRRKGLAVDAVLTMMEWGEFGDWRQAKKKFLVVFRCGDCV